MQAFSASITVFALEVAPAGRPQNNKGFSSHICSYAVISEILSSRKSMLMLESSKGLLRIRWGRTYTAASFRSSVVAVLRLLKAAIVMAALIMTISARCPSTANAVEIFAAVSSSSFSYATSGNSAAASVILFARRSCSSA